MADGCLEKANSSFVVSRLFYNSIIYYLLQWMVLNKTKTDKIIDKGLHVVEASPGAVTHAAREDRVKTSSWH